MNRIINWLIQIYSTLLFLYPSKFRAEFGDELRAVFDDAAHDAARQGTRQLILLFVRELRDMPFTAFREYWRQRRNAHMQNKTRLSPLELLIIAIPFWLYLAMTITESIQISWVGVLVLILFGGVTILAIVSLFKGVPLWSFPALGLLLSVLNLIGFGLWSSVLESMGPPPLLLREIFGAGVPYIGIIVLTLLIMLVTASIKPLRPFFKRIQQDYTLLPLMLYGIMPVTILISFDEYQGESLYKIGITLVLIACLLFYLQNIQPRQKLFWLGIGITLAMAIEAIGKWILVPSQNWPYWFGLHTIEHTQQTEVISTIYTWFWMMVIVFLPAVLGLLPHRKQTAPGVPSLMAK